MVAGLIRLRACGTPGAPQLARAEQSALEPLVTGGCLVAVVEVPGQVADAPGRVLGPGEYALGVELLQRITSLPEA